MNFARLAAAATAALMTVNATGTSVAATATCFQAADIEAEQAIRYQTELMVLSDTCNVSSSYRDFTVRLRDTIVQYQHQLIDHFRRAGAKSPEATLDKFLTQIANELSMRSGAEQRPVICARSATFLSDAAKLTDAEFRNHVAELATEHEKSYRVCK